MEISQLQYVTQKNIKSTQPKTSMNKNRRSSYSNREEKVDAATASNEEI
jgi:hypothetical protein